MFRQHMILSLALLMCCLLSYDTGAFGMHKGVLLGTIGISRVGEEFSAAQGTCCKIGVDLSIFPGLHWSLDMVVWLREIGKGWHG